MRAPRIPFAREVELRFEEFGDFVTQYSKDLSLTGMFLRTTHPHPPGSSFQFEFQIEGGQPLIRGFGEVVWTRAREDPQERLHTSTALGESRPGRTDIVDRRRWELCLTSGRAGSGATSSTPSMNSSRIPETG